MITEKEIEQAAEKESNAYHFKLPNKSGWRGFQEGFKSGANLVLKDMDSEMCLFAEWTQNNAYTLEDGFWYNNVNQVKRYTTSELLKIYKNRAK